MTERLPKLPPLESSNRLTRSTFERCYAAIPSLKKAELSCNKALLALTTKRL